jgi:hypothetical protein
MLRVFRTEGKNMKKNILKYIIVAVVALAFVVSVIPAVTAASEPTILEHPQQPVFATGKKAEYKIKASGAELNYHWFVIYNGYTYDTEAVTDQPWEWYLEKGSYGPSEDGTSYIFNSIPAELDGMKIYCVVRNGSGFAKSYAATVNVKKNAPTPSEISVPASYSYANLTTVTAKCTVAKDANKCDYLWYESTDGDLKNCTELPLQDDATLIVNGDFNGTRYYICRVTNPKGGVTYSSAIAIKTSWDPSQTTPAPETTVTPQTTPSADTQPAPDDSIIPDTSAPLPGGEGTTEDISAETTAPIVSDAGTTSSINGGSTSPEDITPPSETTDGNDGNDGGCGSAVGMALLPAIAAVVCLRRKEN